MEISGKLFTYVDRSSDLTQSMLNDYQNSMIILGDQKQMFIPLINSYVGLGMDTYNYLLNKALSGEVPKALVSKGTTVTRVPNEVYGINGSTTSGSRIPTRWYVHLDNGDKELKDGMTISFRLPTNGLGTVGECLTLDDDESHFHQIVYNSNSLLTTHFPINSLITVQYDAASSCSMYGKYNSNTGKYESNGNTQTSVQGVWRVLTEYYTDTDVRYQQTILYGYLKTPTDGAICRYTLCMMNKEGKMTSLTLTNNSTATTKTMYSGYLDPKKVYYWNTTTHIGSNSNIDGYNTFLTHNGNLIDYRYTFNCGTTLTPRTSFYIVGTIDENGFKLDPTQPWSCSLPTSEDGKVYIYVGMVYPETSVYRGTLEENNTIYIYKDGGIRIYSGFSDLTYHAIYSDYSYTSSLSSYSQCSYTSYIVSASTGIYPVSFVQQNNNIKYLSYSYVTIDKNFGLPSGYTENDLTDIHNDTINRYKGFSSGLYYYENKHVLFSTYFRGMLLGVSSYADSLYTARKINGTNFDGLSNITTTYWGNSKNFNISDYTSAHTGPDTSVNGFQNVTLKLPNTLTVDIIGKSTYANTTYLSNQSYRQHIKLTATDSSYYILFTDQLANNVFSYSYISEKLKFNPYNGTFESTYFKGWLKGNADAAVKLLNSRTINGTSFNGTSNITTSKWGTARNITISDNSGTYTYVNPSINGSANFTLKLPNTLTVNIHGNSDTSNYSSTTYLSNNNYRSYKYGTTSNNTYYISFTDHINTYSYSYVNAILTFNPSKQEIKTTYIHATSLFRGQIRARNQWGVIDDNGVRPLYVEIAETTTSQTNDSGGGPPI